MLAAYDLAKKASVRGNCVLGVLLGSTSFGCAAFLTALICSGRFTAALAGVDLSVLTLGILKSCIVASSWVFTFCALKTLPITIATPIRASSPALVFITALFIYGEVPSFVQAIGLISVFVGYWMFSWAGKHEGIDFLRNRAVWCAVAGSVLAAGSSLWDKYVFQVSASPIEPTQLVYQLGLVAVYGSLIFIKRLRGTTPFAWRWTIPFVGIFLALSDYLMFNGMSIVGTPVSVASLVRRFSIVLTFIFGALIFKETNLKRKALALLFVLLGILLLCFKANALPPPEEYSARMANAPIMIDGRADDADWQSAPWITRFCDITGDESKSPTLRTRAKILWSEEALYVFAELEEPHVVATLTNRDDIVWHENDFEIFIDPDGDGENYFEFEFNAANTVFDLFLTRPYDDPRGNFVMHQWDAAGLQSATKRTANGWTIEVAIPNAALANGFELPLKERREIRVGFSRVEWLKKEREENWTWGATGKINMHIPSRWGRVTLLPKDFPIAVWTRDENAPFEDWAKLGITEVIVDCGGFDLAKHRAVAARAKSVGLTYRAWVTALLKGDAPRDWYTINRLGESAADESGRAYVPYYATLDPHHPEVRRYLVENCASLAAVDGVDDVQLDYIRYADVILAEALWPKYGVDGREEPKADACYCTRCRADYAKVADSLSWTEWREGELSSLVGEIAAAVHARGKTLSAAVFPAPETYARRMVRQNWSAWTLDSAFAMNYNDFYLKNVDWIADVVAEEARALPKGAKLYSGLKLAPVVERSGYVDPERLGIAPQDLARAIRLSVSNGASGVSLFTPSDMTKAHFEVIGSRE